MTVSLFDSRLYGTLFGDEPLRAIFQDTAEIARMVSVERALARVQGSLGVIPPDVAAGIDHGLAEMDVAPASLAEGTAAAGVPIPALVTVLRQNLPVEIGAWIHWGATSQDIVDSAQMLGLLAASRDVVARLQSLLDRLEQQARRYARTPMAARTRGQIATPITFGLRIANWAAPLIDLASHVPAAVVQFGGASGANTAIAPHGPAVWRGLADALGLAAVPPWHTNRLPLIRHTDWYCAIASALATMAEDLILMMRSEIAEVSAGAGGGSSTMPHKSNPVGPEAIATLAHLAHTARSGLSRAHREERDGAAWALEWALVPQIVMATGAALRHAQQLADCLEADEARMRHTLVESPGVMAEAASFALARHMPRPEAQALVKSALTDAQPFAAALADRSGLDLDWNSILSPDRAAKPSATLIDEIFAARS